MTTEEEILKIVEVYVDKCEYLYNEYPERVGKYEVTSLKWSSWVGNFWVSEGIFDTEELANEHKNKLKGIIS